MEESEESVAVEGVDVLDSEDEEVEEDEEDESVVDSSAVAVPATAIEPRSATATMALISRETLPTPPPARRS